MGKISLQFGSYIVEMKKYKDIVGHDDSLPYSAELWVNGKLLATCYNSGWGEDTNIVPKDNDLFENVNKIVAETKGAYDHKDWSYTMPIVADILAYKHKKLKTIKQKEKNHLVFENKDGILYLVPFYRSKKKIPIKEVPMPMLINSINKHKAKGLTLLNNNIPTW